MENMALPKGLLIRSNGYYFQARIPKRYLSHYPKQTIYDKLPVETRQEAIKLVHERWAELHQQFALIDSSGSKLKQIPTGMEADHLIATAIHARMNADEEIRTEGVEDDSMHEQLVSWSNEADEAERLAISRGKLTPHAIDIASDWLRGGGYDVDIESESFKQFAIKFMKAQSQATKSIKLRDSGEHIETPPAPLRQSTIKTTETDWDSLDKLREYWLSQPAKSGNAKKSRTAEAEAITIIKKFKKMVGNLKPSEITRSHIADLKDKMLAEGSSPATINKGRGILAAIFATAEQNGKIEKNPFVGMEKLKVPEKEVESPYTILELQHIFNSPIFTKGYRTEELNGEATYWLPLLSLYSGARLNELGQLYVDDVGKDEGIDFYMIKPDIATGRTVKDNKKRRVPIHPDLIKMGFLEYVAKIKAEGHSQLFPELKITSKDRKIAANWGDSWSEYVRKELGFTKIHPPFHAFRHSCCKFFYC